jgi:hypothetical protein
MIVFGCQVEGRSILLVSFINDLKMIKTKNLIYKKRKSGCKINFCNLSSILKE